MHHVVAAGSLLPLLKHIVIETKIHPVLVNFTAALVPVSWGSDIAGRLWRNEGLRATGWWTLCFAALITPLTVATGWLFWMPEDRGAAGMVIHKWLGTVFVLLLAGFVLWRWHIHRRDQYPDSVYLFIGLILVCRTGLSRAPGRKPEFCTHGDFPCPGGRDECREINRERMHSQHTATSSRVIEAGMFGSSKCSP